MSPDILSAFRAQALACPQSLALLSAQNSCTYAWLERAASLACAALREANAFDCPWQPVPRIGLYCPNGVDHVVWALAILMGGACLVPIPQELTEAERLALVRQTALHATVSAGGLIWTDPCAQPATLVFSLHAAAALTCFPPVAAPFSEAQFAEVAPALIRFSSGTTGASKGVVLSHRTLLARIASANRRLRITHEDRVLWTLPMAHHFAVSILLYLSAGAGVVLEDSHLATDLLDAANRWGATVMYGAPYHYRLLAGDVSGRSWSTLRLAVSTAAALSEEVAVWFRSRYGVPLTQGLGIIEAGLPLLNLRDAQECPTALGSAEDFEVVLLDETGQPGDVGELCLRGPGMFDAYLVPWRKREEVMADGWFHTGDVARRHTSGNLELCGRIKSVLNISGMKCFPEEIEEVLRQHPGVCEARVRGEENVRWGTFIVAEVVLVAASEMPISAELTLHCRQRLASYKVPLRFESVERLEKTANGKLRR